MIHNIGENYIHVNCLFSYVNYQQVRNYTVREIEIRKKERKKKPLKIELEVAEGKKRKR